ncbi:interferon-induced, double-stranded RNA-activated protein kinase isoform X2 [Amblyraja radiata]|uniref:interferon-induced, double-stranded RNA-activated protein kinase isoform X2 n=1 Tax=Amblyraja radiata TaxID=386614 RepID=UPI001402882B|nr:interferon-induced, double-stranded RNA-activated protein kinase isoform X2 [Amblyraja radiata]
MATTELGESDASYKYVEELQLHAGKIKEILVWNELQSGPPHDIVFITNARIGERIFSQAQGKTKKKAKQNAAKIACEELGLQNARSNQSFDSTSRTPSPASTDNYISKLNDYSQKKTVRVEYVDEQIATGMDHVQKFRVHVVIGNKKYPEAFGRSKQEARREAAKLAYEEMQEQQSPFKNLDKSPVEVRSEEDSKGAAEYSPNNNPKSSTEDQMVQSEEMSDISSGSTSNDNSKDFSSRTSASGSTNVIGEINEICQKMKWHLKFEQVDRRGPSHVPEFSIKCLVEGKEFPSATGKTKQEAKQRAAQLALDELKTSSDMSWASGNMSNSSSQSWIVIKDSSTPGDRPKPTSSEPSTPSMDDGQDKKRGAMSFDNFTDKEIIGKGGFGCVYKAKYILDEIYYAIKEVPFKDDRTRREVTLLAKLEHSNIVRYHTCWTEERDNKKYLYIQMKLYGKNLKDWIEDFKNYQSKKKFNSLDIMRQLLDGVEYIHLQDLFHRDLKPANVFLTEETKLEAKIGDFGLAREIDQNPLTMNAGTFPYMSPEQCAQHDYDHKVDIFALGLIFFELLWMYHGTVSERSHTWIEIRKGKFRESFVKEHPAESALIQKMLSEDPKERPEAAEMKRELDALCVQTNEEDKEKGKEEDKEEDPPQIPISDQKPN